MADYTRCRTIGHAWFDADSDDWKTMLGTPLTLRCERCMTERREIIGDNGELVRRHYSYPLDYRYAVGSLPPKEDFRLALIALRLQEARAARRNARKAPA